MRLTVVLLHLGVALLPVSRVLSASLPANPYGVAREPVPVFSAPQLPSLLRQGDEHLPRDRCGQVRQLEFVALAGTPFRLHDCQLLAGAQICRVSTPDYQPASGRHLYLDSALLTRSDNPPAPRQRQLPEASVITGRLLGRLGTPYVWGGNLRLGVRSAEGRVFQGVDCSGLLYEATDGATPRNTSQLVHYGVGVAIAGLSAAALAEALQPLDLIVWDGHVIIVIDGERTIESRLDCYGAGGGVVLRPLRDTVGKIVATRRGVDEWPVAASASSGLFVVRRWCGIGR